MSDVVTRFEKVKVPPCTCDVEREHTTMVHCNECPRGYALRSVNMGGAFVAQGDGTEFMWAGRNGDYFANCDDCRDTARGRFISSIDGHHQECPRLRPLAEWCKAHQAKEAEKASEPAPPETMTRVEIEALIRELAAYESNRHMSVHIAHDHKPIAGDEALIRRISEEVARKVKAEPVKIECAMEGGFDPDREAAAFAERAKNGADPNPTKLRLAAAEKIIAEQDAELGKWRARDENEKIEHGKTKTALRMAESEYKRLEAQVASQRREIVARDSALEEAHKREDRLRREAADEKTWHKGTTEALRAERAKLVAVRRILTGEVSVEVEVNP